MKLTIRITGSKTFLKAKSKNNGNNEISGFGKAFQSKI